MRSEQLPTYVHVHVMYTGLFLPGPTYMYIRTIPSQQEDMQVGCLHVTLRTCKRDRCRQVASPALKIWILPSTSPPFCSFSSSSLTAFFPAILVIPLIVANFASDSIFHRVVHKANASPHVRLLPFHGHGCHGPGCAYRIGLRGSIVSRLRLSPATFQILIMFRDSILGAAKITRRIDGFSLT
jgi:hypothetical protein